MQTITIEDLKKLSVVELKAFVYDQTSAIQGLDSGIKIAREIIAEKTKQPELPETEAQETPEE